MGVVLSAGGAFSWFRDQLARELRDAHGAASSVDAQLDIEARAIAPGAEGVTFLPYLQGERTPHRDASARGAFLGLSLAHTRAHMTRAVIEGVCFAMRDSLTILQELHLAPTSLLLTGGGARSGLLRQLQADIYGMPITTVNLEEGPAYGAALLAAVGVGAFRDIATAARATLTRAPVEAPTVGAHEQYEHAYARYRAAYGALRPVMQMP
jgi:xylulokinase